MSRVQRRRPAGLLALADHRVTRFFFFFYLIQNTDNVWHFLPYRSKDTELTCSGPRVLWRDSLRVWNAKGADGGLLHVTGRSRRTLRARLTRLGLGFSLVFTKQGPTSASEDSLLRVRQTFCSQTAREETSSPAVLIFTEAVCLKGIFCLAFSDWTFFTRPG